MNFKILSLDGGGVRGYLSAKVLANMESYLNVINNNELPIGQRFDFIAGTSTGGIIALALSIGKTAKYIEEKYRDNIPRIFSNKKNGFLFISPKYKSYLLEEMVEDVFNNLCLKDVKTHVLVTSVSLDDAKPRFYKSGYFRRNTGRVDEKLTDIAMATSAAPTYFEVRKKLKHSQNLIDGGVCANNPSLLALIDALGFEKENHLNTAPPKDINDIVLVSIGTGKMGEMPYTSSKLIGNVWLFNWARPIIDILMESQSQLADYQTKFLLKDKYLRINPTISFKMELDDISKINNLNNLADLDMDIENFLKNNF